jgi:transketolase
MERHYIDGHDMNQIDNAVEKAKKTKGKPTMIVAETVKGKGVHIWKTSMAGRESSQSGTER